MNDTSNMTGSTSINVGWFRDPLGKYEYRYFDKGWTAHVTTNGISVIDTAWANSNTLPESQAPGALAEQNWRDASEPESTFGTVAAGIGLGLLGWLGPALLLAAIALIVFHTGSTETVDMFGETTRDASDRVIGFSGFFFALGVAWFFGHGTFGRILSVIRGQAGLSDILFMRSYVISALVTIASLGAAVLLLIVGING